MTAKEVGTVPFLKLLLLGGCMFVPVAWFLLDRTFALRGTGDVTLPVLLIGVLQIALSLFGLNGIHRLRKQAVALGDRMAIRFNRWGSVVGLIWLILLFVVSALCGEWLIAAMCGAGAIFCGIYALVLYRRI